MKSKRLMMTLSSICLPKAGVLSRGYFSAQCDLATMLALCPREHALSSSYKMGTVLKNYNTCHTISTHGGIESIGL